MVEFALVVFPLLVFVAGIVQFGIGLSYWHDQNRIVNQAARYAAINSWPGCPPTELTCTANPACAGSPTGRSLANYVSCEASTNGLRDSLDPPQICFPPGSTGQVGEAIRVRLTSPFEMLPILGGFTIQLRAEASMRLVTAPTKVGAAPCP
jgi:hypothetical protein